MSTSKKPTPGIEVRHGRGCPSSRRRHLRVRAGVPRVGIRQARGRQGSCKNIRDDQRSEAMAQ